MSNCKECDKEHAMVIEDKVTGECAPIDHCYQCLFKDQEPSPFDYVTLANINIIDYSAKLRKAQDGIIREILIYSAVPSPIPDGSI